MLSSHSLWQALVLGTCITAAASRACPIAIIAPPPGTDIGLCSNNCELQCFYAPETNGICSNGPASYPGEVITFEVLSNQLCTIYSDENCGSPITELQGPGNVFITATFVKSIKCES